MEAGHQPRKKASAGRKAPLHATWVVLPLVGGLYLLLPQVLWLECLPAAWRVSWVGSLCWLSQVVLAVLDLCWSYILPIFVLGFLSRGDPARNISCPQTLALFRLWLALCFGEANPPSAPPGHFPCRSDLNALSKASLAPPLPGPSGHQPQLPRLTSFASPCERRPGRGRRRRGWQPGF